MAARQGRQDFAIVLDLLRKHDPEGLRAKGMDATARATFYASRVAELAQAA
jgi:hypothetical protein